MWALIEGKTLNLLKVTLGGGRNVALKHLPVSCKHIGPKSSFVIQGLVSWNKVLVMKTSFRDTGKINCTKHGLKKIRYDYFCTSKQVSAFLSNSFSHWTRIYFLLSGKKATYTKIIQHSLVENLHLKGDFGLQFRITIRFKMSIEIHRKQHLSLKPPICMFNDL